MDIDIDLSMMRMVRIDPTEGCRLIGGEVPE